MRSIPARIRASRDGSRGRSGDALAASTTDCSWEAMREVYTEQAARGVPEAVRGLEHIRQDRWPTTGRPRG